MNTDLQKLIELEAVDTEIHRLQQEISELPKRVAVIEEKLRGVRARMEQVRADVQRREKARRGFEDDIKSQQQKISKFREQSLSVKTNDQYKALMHEIEFAEAEIRKIEDRILEGMEAVEGEQAEIRAAEAEEKSQAAAVEAEKKMARERTAEDEAALKQRLETRAKLRQEISEPSLVIYDRVRRGRGNAMAELRNGMCSACFVLLRQQRLNEVKGGEQLHTCESCGRILFYNPAQEAAAAAQPQAPKRTQAGGANSGEQDGPGLDSSGS